MKSKNKLNENEYGGFMITNSVLNSEEVAAFWFKDEPVVEQDNGWRIVGMNDTGDYIDNPDNWSVVGVNTVFEIMPFILKIFEMPVGTDLQVVFSDEGIVTQIYDVNDEGYLLDVDSED